MKTKLAVILLWISLLITSACSINQNKKQDVWLANPASIYCQENGWTLELMFDFGETYGVCHFPDWSFCEEREFYRGECKPSWNQTWSNTDTTIIDFQTCMDAWHAIMESNPRKCKFGENIFTEKIQDTVTENTKNTTWENIEDIFCTMDAKQCPDWSYVGRVWPDCEFAPCPNETKNDTKNIQKILDDHKKNTDINSTWLTESDIDLMEKIIDQLK